MNNLPNDNNQTSQLGQSSLDPRFVGGPESAPEITPLAEEAAPSEELFSLENLKTPEIPKQQETKAPVANINTPSANEPVSDTQAIVDKTEKITHLHHIAGTNDKLTEEADEEEEHFIEEVEKHHGDL